MEASDVLQRVQFSRAKQRWEAYTPDCHLHTVKRGCGSVMVWAAISWNSLGSIVALHGRINIKDYPNILRDHVHPMVQAFLFPDGDGIFQDNNALKHTAHVVKNWYEEHEREIKHSAATTISKSQYY